MNKINYISLTLKSPIRIGDVKPNFNFLPTKNTIPGSIIRGAVAEYLISRQRASEISDFVKNIRFGFFYPSCNSDIFPLSLPITALTCKNYKGFKSLKNGHGIFDSIIPLIAYEELKNTYGAKFPVPFTFTCPKCESRMDRFFGLYIKKNEIHYNINIDKISQTKVAINRNRKVAENGMLYSITALKPTNFFVGKIIGDKQKINIIFESLMEKGIGAHTTKGYGKISEIKEIQCNIEPIKNRIVQFNEKLKRIWNEILSIAINKKELPKEPKAFYFSIDLLSPTIFTNNGIPTLKLNISLNKTKFKPFIFSSDPTFIGGWSTAWGLPKETTYGADAGSTYIFKIEKDFEDYIPQLENVEYNGIGYRTDEGYGDIIICHPFHKEVDII